jgi:hypothetical protein
MPIEIEEVIRRSEQGVTQPYICRGANGKTYFVKGKGAGYNSLQKEWIAGGLALRMGLPIAPFNQVVVARELYEAGRTANLGDLGFGILFGSENIPSSSEISFVNVSAISNETKRDIAAFDWWAKNGDRTISQSGGNPNILWSESQEKPFIIDHNLAFDDSVTLNSLLKSHIFASSLEEIRDQPSLQGEYEEKFESALTGLDIIIGSIPSRWHYVDEAESVEVSFSTDFARAVLQRHRTSGFWKQT